MAKKIRDQKNSFALNNQQLQLINDRLKSIEDKIALTKKRSFLDYFNITVGIITTILISAYAVLNYDKFLEYLGATKRSVIISEQSLSLSRKILEQTAHNIEINTKDIYLTHKPIIYVVPADNRLKELNNPFEIGFEIVNSGKMPANHLYMFYMYSLKAKNGINFFNILEKPALDSVKVYPNTRMLIHPQINAIRGIPLIIEKAEVVFFIFYKGDINSEIISEVIKFTFNNKSSKNWSYSSTDRTLFKEKWKGKGNDIYNKRKEKILKRYPDDIAKKFVEVLDKAIPRI